VGVGEVAEALRAANRNVSAGFLIENSAEYVVQGFGRIEQLDDLRDVVVVHRNGAPVRVAHLTAAGPLLALAGILLMGWLVQRRVPGALLLGILAVAAAGFATGAAALPLQLAVACGQFRFEARLARFGHPPPRPVLVAETGDYPVRGALCLQPPEKSDGPAPSIEPQGTPIKER
jgi:hypothetical protein